MSYSKTRDSLFRDTYLAKTHNCEWCDSTAVWKTICSSNYARYSCAQLQHHKKTQHLSQLDGHKDATTVYSSQGFPL